MQPIVVHVNSFGKKRGKFQDIIHNEEDYFFLPLDGKKKSHIYSKQVLDGSKESILMYPDFQSSIRDDTVSILAIRREKIKGAIQNGLFSSRMPVNQFVEIQVNEAQRFIQDYCFECEAYGTPSCAQTMNYFCAEEDRERYRDSTWFAIQKEMRQNRKERRSTALPN